MNDVRELGFGDWKKSGQIIELRNLTICNCHLRTRPAHKKLTAIALGVKLHNKIKKPKGMNDVRELGFGIGKNQDK